MPFMIMEHVVPPDEELFSKIGDISTFDVFNNHVLIAIYMRPERTMTGIILTDQHRDEDRYQSKVGLILKIGPAAFQDPQGLWFKNGGCEVGDWVVYRPADGWSLSVNDTNCRMLVDTNIRMRIPHPDYVW